MIIIILMIFMQASVSFHKIHWPHLWLSTGNDIQRMFKLSEVTVFQIDFTISVATKLLEAVCYLRPFNHITATNNDLSEIPPTVIPLTFIRRIVVLFCTNVKHRRSIVLHYKNDYNISHNYSALIFYCICTRRIWHQIEVSTIMLKYV